VAAVVEVEGGAVVGVVERGDEVEVAPGSLVGVVGLVVPALVVVVEAGVEVGVVVGAGVGVPPPKMLPIEVPPVED
jgi:hypothetical protein